MGVASLDLQQTDVGQGMIDYGRIINKPKINGVTLEGNLSTEDINIFIPQRVSELQNDAGYITKNVSDLVYYYDKTEVDNMISAIPKFDIKVVDALPTEDISPTTIYLLMVPGEDHFEEYIYVDDEWDKLGDGNIDLSDYATYEYVDAELAEKVDAADLATVALSGRYSDLIGTPTNLSQFTNDTGFITAAALPTKTSDLTNDGEDGTSTYVESNELATVATSGSYNDLTDTPTIDFELVEMSYGESNAWAKFIAAYQGHKIVYCRASSNANPATGTQGRKAFMAYVNNADNPTEVEFQYVRSVSSKTASQPVDQVFVYKLTNANGGTWTVETRNMAPKLAQGTNTTVSYSSGTYTISATQPTVNDATLTIQKNGTTVETFTANSSTNKTANIVVPTKTSDITNDSDFVNSTQVGTALAAYTYPSQDLYTQSDIDTMLAQISSLKIEVVNALPQTGNADTIYLLRVRQQGNDLYQEYFWVNNAWELIGGIDLTDYYTKTEVNTLLTAKADVSAIPTKTSDLTNDSNFAVDANYVHTDNNYTTTEKNKLAGIAAGAEVNVQSDWNQTTTTADDFIKNKPSIPTKTSDLTNDSGFITTAAIPTNVSAFNNDAGYLDEIPDDSVGLNQLDSTVVNALNNINNKANTADLAAVAFSGDYDDLTDKPTIPTKTSDLTNDSGFLSSIPIASSSVLGGIKVGSGLSISSGGVLSANGGGTADDVAWGHITGTMADQTDLTTALAAKANSADLATVATSGDYDDLTDKPTIGTGLLTLKNNNVVIGTFSANSTSARTITVTTPTKTSDLTNDSGFLTSYTETDPIYSASPAAGITATDISSWNAKSDFSGSYNDLTDKPTIGNATLTIQKNGTSAGTFTANATSNKTINITVPTTAADVSALPASTKYGASIEVSVNTTNYKITTTLKDQDGNTLGTAQVIDLPLESVVVNGSYDSTNKKIVLTLQSGSTIDIPVADLVAGLQTEITSTNKLASDLVDDTSQTHKFMTSAEKTKLSGIAAGAEVNVQSDWNQTTTTADDYIKNKPTLATVATSGSYNDLSNKPTIPAAQVNSDWNATSGLAQILNKPTLATVATSGSYNDLTNKPTIPTKTSDLTNDGSDNTAQYLETDGTAYRTTSIPYGQCDSTSTSTVYTATIPGITELRDGICMWLKNGVVTSAANFTININGLGAKPVYSNLAAASRESTLWNVAYTMLFVYDSDRVAGGCWVLYRGYDSNTNTIGYQVRTNSSTLPAKETGYRYRLWLTSADGQGYVPINTSSSTSTTGTKALNTDTPIDPFGAIVYNSTNGTVNANASLPTGTQWSQYTLDVRYQKYPLTLTYPDPVYLQCTPQSAGGALINDIVQALPTTEDGKIYIYLGNAYSATSMELKLEHPVYHYKDGAIRQWTNAEAGGISSVAWGDITGTLSNQTDLNTALGAKANSADLAAVATSGAYSDLSGKPTIPAAQVNSDWDATSGVAQILNKPTLATVATSGSYNDLSNKPTIPTVNNATLTIQKNGTTVKTFTANASSNVTANITVPTKTSDLTNDSGFVNSTAIAGKQDLLTAGDHINITGTTIKATDYVHSEQPVATSSVTPVVTGSMISNGTITADKLATGATLKLTLSTSDIGEGSALAANTLYGVYQ